MPSTSKASSVPILGLALIGIVVFAMSLLTTLSAAAPRGAYAQEGEPEAQPEQAVPEAEPECRQPAESGCPMAIGRLARAAMSQVGVTHNWILDLGVNNDLTVTLFNLPTDLQLSVYGPNDSLLGQVSDLGVTQEVLQITNVGTGTYWISVDSPNGGSSPEPYMLIATLVAPEVAPFMPYEQLPPAQFTPYRS
jgi:hypothetical protein